MSIERYETNPKLSRVVVHNGTAYLSGLTADDKTVGTKEQTAQVLAKADQLFATVGTDRTKVLLAHIYLRDIADWDAMNEAWITWLDGAAAPARATVAATLGLPEIAVEIQFTAAI
ncbi:RidA family protein [Acuticoccus kandeliae]|uniref:RidA family protein n=1 Tax=Acuticoccus kandeliae TaxID=2073160 RepID=UPI000D3E389A|nr:RidA family protein [Acuticoccus kandeliae]